MLRILQQPLDGDRVGETDLLQLLYRAHGWGDGNYRTASFHQPSPKFFQRCCLTGPCGATDAYRQIARSENEFHGMLLFGAQTV